LHVHVLPAAAFNQKVSYFRSKAGPALANAPRGYTYTKQYTAKLRAAAATHSIVKNSCIESNCPMPYNGGAVQHTPKVWLLFWGPNWFTDPTQNTSAGYTINFFKGLGVTSDDVWSTIMTQYNDGGGNVGFGPGTVLAGAYQDTSVPSFGLTQTQLATEANALQAFVPITDTADADVVIVTQPGTCPVGFAPGGCPGNHAYCAWHSYANLPYTNLPFQQDAGGSCGENSVSGVNDGFSIVGGHEYAETATDPFFGGYVDNSDPGGGEIGDKCAWFDLGFTFLSTGAYPTQPLYSNSEYSLHGAGCTQNEFDLSLSPVGGTTTLSVGQGTTLTATTNMSVGPTPWYIVIYDVSTSSVAKECGSGTVCSVTVTGDTTQTDVYDAVISHIDGTDAKLGTGTQTVVWTPASTAIGVSQAAAAVTGQKGSFHVTVTGAFPGTGVAAPSGSVTVKDGSSQCVATLSGSNGSSSGNCSMPVPYLSAHALGLTGTYPGDGNFKSSSGSGSGSVGKAGTTMGVSIGGSPPIAGGKATINVSVQGAFTGVGVAAPSGSVTVSDGTRTCMAALAGSNGAATGSCQITEPAAGGFTITGTFAGDANFLTSNNSTSLTVAKSPTKSVLTLSKATILFGKENLESFKVHVTATGGGIPTGTVKIYKGTTVLCTATLTLGSGHCSPTAKKLAKGTYLVSAKYGGDTSDLTSTSSKLSLKVK
jgi:serine protease